MFENKVIAITGASGGLGAALAKQLAPHKPNLFLLSRSVEKLNLVASECREKGACAYAFQGDITKYDDCKRFAEETVKHNGSVDHLVLNAGISMWARFDEVTDISFYQKIMETNYLGAVYLTHLFLPYLKKSKGMITAISSIQGDVAVPNHSGYTASKHALTGFLNTLRMELDDSGIDIMLVKPHWLKETELRKNAYDKNGIKISESGNESLWKKKEKSKEAVDLDQCSKKIIEGMQKRKKELIIPPKLKLLLWLKLLSPALVNKIISKKVKQQE